MSTNELAAPSQVVGIFCAAERFPMTRLTEQEDTDEVLERVPVLRRQICYLESSYNVFAYPAPRFGPFAFGEDQ